MENFKTVPLNKIILKENFRATEQENDVAGLMATIKSDGLLNPVTVKETTRGKYELLAGFRRYTAVKKLGYGEISVNIVPKKSNSIVINQIENLQRKETSSYEIGRGINILVTKEGMSKKEVAIRLGLQQSAVVAFLGLFRDVPKEFRSVVKRTQAGISRPGVISNSVAQQILLLKKGGIINTARTKKLFSMVLKDPSIKVANIRSMGKKFKLGDYSDIEAGRQKELTRSVQVGFNILEKDFNRINKKFEGGFHGAVRDLVRDYFKLKTVK